MILIAISLTMEIKMPRLSFLPASLVAAFAAAVIASPVAAVADETEVQNNLLERNPHRLLALRRVAKSLLLAGIRRIHVNGALTMEP